MSPAVVTARRSAVVPSEGAPLVAIGAPVATLLTTSRAPASIPVVASEARRRSVVPAAEAATLVTGTGAGPVGRPVAPLVAPRAAPESAVLLPIRPVVPVPAVAGGAGTVAVRPSVICAVPPSAVVAGRVAGTGVATAEVTTRGITTGVAGRTATGGGPVVAAGTVGRAVARPAPVIAVTGTTAVPARPVGPALLVPTRSVGRATASVPVEPAPSCRRRCGTNAGRHHGHGPGRPGPVGRDGRPGPRRPGAGGSPIVPPQAIVPRRPLASARTVVPATTVFPDGSGCRDRHRGAHPPARPRGSRSTHRRGSRSGGRCADGRCVDGRCAGYRRAGGRCGSGPTSPSRRDRHRAGCRGLGPPRLGRCRPDRYGPVLTAPIGAAPVGAVAVGPVTRRPARATVAARPASARGSPTGTLVEPAARHVLPGPLAVATVASRTVTAGPIRDTHVTRVQK